MRKLSLILAAAVLLGTVARSSAEQGSSDSSGSSGGHSSNAGHSSSAEHGSSSAEHGSSANDSSGMSSGHSSSAAHSSSADHGSSGHGSSGHGSGHDPCESDEHHRRLGGGAPWWCTRDEYLFVECFMVSGLIILAISFELMEHKIEHLVEHDFGPLKYLRQVVNGTLQFKRTNFKVTPNGIEEYFHKPLKAITTIASRQKEKEQSEKSEKSHGSSRKLKSRSQTVSLGHSSHEGHGHEVGDIDLNSKQPRLTNKLLSRAAGELTILGFIAFVIWSVRTAGWFDLLAESLETLEDLSFRIPKTGGDIVHMLEDVHIHLFIGMIFFYSLVLHTARACDFVFDLWHDMNEEARALEKDNFILGAVQHQEKGIGFMLFSRLRSSTKVYMKQNSKVLFGVDELPMDEFNFSMYLQVTVRLAVDDLIDFNIRTWVAVLVIVLGIFCPILILVENKNTSPLAFSQWLLLALLISVGCVVNYMRSRKHKVMLRANAKIVPEKVDSKKDNEPQKPPCPPPLESTPSPPAMDKAVSSADHAESDGNTCSHPESPDSKHAGSAVNTCSHPESPDSKSGHHDHHNVEHKREHVVQMITEAVAHPHEVIEVLDRNFQTELYLLRFLQVLLMIVCYGIANTLGSKWFWSDRTGLAVMVIVVMLLLHCFMWWAASSVIPWYLAVMAAPPNMDPDNLELAAAVLNHGLTKKAEAKSKWKLMKKYGELTEEAKEAMAAMKAEGGKDHDQKSAVSDAAPQKSGAAETTVRQRSTHESTP